MVRVTALTATHPNRNTDSCIQILSLSHSLFFFKKKKKNTEPIENNTQKHVRITQCVFGMFVCVCWVAPCIRNIIRRYISQFRFFLFFFFVCALFFLDLRTNRKKVVKEERVEVGDSCMNVESLLDGVRTFYVSARLKLKSIEQVLYVNRILCPPYFFFPFPIPYVSVCISIRMCICRYFGCLFVVVGFFFGQIPP